MYYIRRNAQSIYCRAHLLAYKLEVHGWQKGPGGSVDKSGSAVVGHEVFAKREVTMASLFRRAPQAQRFWLKAPQSSNMELTSSAFAKFHADKSWLKLAAPENIF